MFVNPTKRSGGAFPKEAQFCEPLVPKIKVGLNQGRASGSPTEIIV